MFAIWLVGIVLRYAVLLPVRLLMLIGGSIVLLPVLIACNMLRSGSTIFKTLVQYYCALWVMSMTGVVKYHGVPPVRRPNQVYVANHT